MVPDGFKKLVAEERDGGQRIEAEAVVEAARVDEVLDEFYRLMAHVRGIREESRSTLEARLVEALGAGELASASRDFLLNRFTKEAVRALGVDAVLTPGVHAEEPPRFGCDFSFSANITPRPVLTLCDDGPVRVRRPRIAVEECDVDDQVAYAQRQCAEFRPADHADVRVGDIALMDVRLLKNGELCRDLSGLGRRVEVAEGLVPAGFVAGVRGLRAGEERSFSFEADDDRYEADVKLHEVLVRILPVVDDAWVARTLPDFGDVAGLRRGVRADLERQREKVERQELVYRVRAVLAERLVGTVPDELYDEAKESLMRSTLASIEAEGGTLATYCEEHGTTEGSFNVQVFLQAAEVLRQNLALDALARSRGIVETDEEVRDAKAALPPSAAGLSDAEFERRGFRAALGESIRRKKALTWLMETVIVEDEPARATRG